MAVVMWECSVSHVMQSPTTVIISFPQMLVSILSLNISLIFYFFEGGGGDLYPPHGYIFFAVDHKHSKQKLGMAVWFHFLLSSKKLLSSIFLYESLKLE